VTAFHYPEPSLWSLRRRQTDPIGFLEALARQGDFVPFVLARRQAFLLNHPDYVSAVLVSHSDTFRKGPANDRARHLLGNGLLTADGALHAARRAAIQPAFARKRLEDCSPLIVARTRAMCDTWTDTQVVDVTGAIGALTFGIVGEAVIGAAVEPLFEDVRRAACDATASVDPLVSLVAPLREVRVAQERLRAIVEKLVSHAGSRSASGGLLSLLHTPDSDPMLRAQLIDDVLTILLAGHDTITSALTWTWLLLSSHAGVEEKLRAELDSVLGDREATARDLPDLVYTRGVLAEALRLYPPAWVLARHAVEAHQFAGGEVPAGALVLVSQYLLHRDERYFARPDVFDPDRWQGSGKPDRPRLAYFPFGAGARSCIGEAFAWMEGVLVLATIAQRWRLGPLGTAFPDIEARITLRPRQRVLLRASAI
jgi:cytochrome P450